MDIQLVDVTVRFYEDLNSERLRDLEEALRGMDGVVSIHSPRAHSHVMLVEYNRACINSTKIIDRVTQQGINAELAVPERIF